MLKLDPSVQESCQSRVTTNFCLCFPFKFGEGRYPEDGFTWNVAQDGTLTRQDSKIA